MSTPSKALPGALLVLAATAPGQGQMAAIHPASSHLVGGQARAFQVRPTAAEVAASVGLAHLPGSAASAWVWRVREGPGSIDPTTGVYTAPQVDRPTWVRLEARHPQDGGPVLGAALLVLPPEPFDLLDKVQGSGWLEPFTSVLPFRDLATGRRFQEASWRVESIQSWRPEPTPVLAGYGLPFTVRWTPLPGAEAQLLSYREGDEVVRREVSGLSSLELTARGRVSGLVIEGLLPKRAGSRALWSETQEGAVHLRGLVPFAGNPLGPPEHQDGRGLSARFVEPFGMARFESFDPTPFPRSGLLVADAGAHVLRCVAKDGRVTTLWGRPGVPGHQDTASPSFLQTLSQELCPRPESPEEPAVLFNRPTFLFMNIWYRDCLPHWACLVADSGNHVLREVQPGGRVITFAGVPGQAGHKDAWFSSWALFNDPQGLAKDDDGYLYVADRGNRVLRRISPWGQVETFAGKPGAAGSADGPAAEARFTAPCGLLHVRDAPGGPALFVTDGHAVRRVGLPGGEVSTPLGDAARPGFRDVRGGSLEGRVAALREPNLNAPCGLLAGRNGLYLADEGNRAVRFWSYGDATLVTTAGDPAEQKTRWGLPRDGLEGPLDEGYAALERPRTLAASPEEPRDCLVATGSCLAALSPSLGRRDRMLPPQVDAVRAQAWEPCVVRFLAEARSRSGTRTFRPMDYAVAFLEPDGTLAARRRGSGMTGTALSVQGTFTQRGQGKIVVRCVSDQGVSAGATLEVAIP